MGKTKIAEIKIQVEDLNPFRQWLEEKKAMFIGKDRQKDTYFQVSNARLKLREGQIENTLIHYHRPDVNGHKLSNVTYHKVVENISSLKSVLEALFPIDIIIEKTREIYWIENTKFHLDDVEQLGQFIEIEVMDLGGVHSRQAIHKKLDFYLTEWELEARNGIPESYADLKHNHVQ